MKLGSETNRSSYKLRNAMLIAIKALAVGCLPIKLNLLHAETLAATCTSVLVCRGCTFLLGYFSDHACMLAAGRYNRMELRTKTVVELGVY